MNDISGLTLEILLDRIMFIDKIIEIHKTHYDQFMESYKENGPCDYYCDQMNYLTTCIHEDREIKNMLLSPVYEDQKELLMIDISSLPEHELAGLDGFEAKVLYKVVRNVWRNCRDLGSKVSGVFLDHKTARSFVESMADREERSAKEDSWVKEYTILWDRDGNCDDGFSIIYKEEDQNDIFKTGDIEYCIDYAIEKVPLWYKP